MRTRLLCLALACAGLFAAHKAWGQFFQQRIMSYNIRHGAGMDNVLDLARQADVINAAKPDIVGLQEVDSIVPRSERMDETRRLARACGMYGTFGKAIPLSGGGYGVAILSKEEPLSVKNIPLPGKEKRTLLVCEFEKYVFACTHLDLEEENRLTSADIIIEEADQWEKPFLICGDWNDEPSSKLITKLKKSFVFLNDISKSTYPADKPTKCIDYIAVKGRTAVKLTTEVINEPVASDHRPVVVLASVKDLGDGVETIQDEDLLDESADENLAPVFDLSGRCVRPNAKGIYIKNGKKLLK
ncbi:MAG: endonuclease/exonuclease/phosphatase family protein [Bacteroidaceae bacterium]|nr:endonuclease/exonuclease/phosphatase family protein [Bacteroidaceae bacterium]